MINRTIIIKENLLALFSDTLKKKNSRESNETYSIIHINGAFFFFFFSVPNNNSLVCL